MTDTIAALAAIKDSDAQARHDLYARFEARWRDEALVSTSGSPRSDVAFAKERSIG